MGDEGGSEAEAANGDEEIKDLTAEQMVDADTAMLLDLGESESLADDIAAQSAGGDTVVDRRLDPAWDPETEETTPEP